MALTKDFVTNFGITIPNAYIRIDSFEGSKYNVRLHIGIYNLVTEQQEVITPVEKEVEVLLEDGTTSKETIIENVVTLEDVVVKKKVEEDEFDIIPNLIDTTNLLAQGYTELKSSEKYNGAIDN